VWLDEKIDLASLLYAGEVRQGAKVGSIAGVRVDFKEHSSHRFEERKWGAGCQCGSPLQKGRGTGGAWVPFGGGGRRSTRQRRSLELVAATVALPTLRKEKAPDCAGGGPQG
jgi:hypothetical protein